MESAAEPSAHSGGGSLVTATWPLPSPTLRLPDDQHNSSGNRHSWHGPPSAHHAAGCAEVAALPGSGQPMGSPRSRQNHESPDSEPRTAGSSVASSVPHWVEGVPTDGVASPHLMFGRRHEPVSWEMVGAKIQRETEEMKNGWTPVHCCILKLQTNRAIHKALQAALNGTQNDCKSIVQHKFLSGETATMDTFQCSDVLVVDYGKDWTKKSDVGFRIQQRHSSILDDTSPKHSIQLIEKESHDELEQFPFSEFSFDVSMSYRVPYINDHNDVYVYVADSLFTPRSSVVNGAIRRRSSGGEQRTKKPAEEFFRAIIEQISHVKNRRKFAGDRANSVVKRFESLLKSTHVQREHLLRAVNLLSTHKELCTEANVLRLMRRFRDMDAWGDMLDVLDIRDGKGVPLSDLTNSAVEVAHYQALALYNRGVQLGDVDGKEDQERAYTLINEVINKFPKSSEVQGLKGKVYKNRFSKEILRKDGRDNEQLAVYHQSALDAYKELAKLEVAEDPDDTAWSTCNLSILYFAAPNWNEYVDDILDSIEKVNIQLQPTTIWRANTLFLINTVGAFLVENYENFYETANEVAGQLLSLPYENWMLQSMLMDLRLIDRVYTDRNESRPKSVHYSRFDFWVDFMEESVDPSSRRKKFPVLVSSNANHIGGGNLGAMDKMSISLINRISPQDTMRSISGGQTDASARLRRESISQFDGRSSMDSTSDLVQIQIAPKCKEEVRLRQVVTPLHLAEIQRVDIPREGEQGGVDARRLGISFATVADGFYGVLSYTVVFPSSKLREQFMESCVKNGWNGGSTTTPFNECPRWRFKTETISGTPSRVLLGEGSYAHVFTGELLGPPLPGEDEDIVSHCAVKQIKESLLKDPSAVTDFIAEVHKIRQLKHKNVVEFIGLWQGPDDAIARTYLMEILDGSLSTLLDMVGGLFKKNTFDESTNAIVAFTAQMLTAVHYLHDEHGFLHRDIKPANFLVRSHDGVVKLSDFGTAMDVSGFNKIATGRAGSFVYTDPNVVKGEKHGLEVDIYGLGSSVWELMTGKHPYHSCATTHDQVIKIRTMSGDSLFIDEEWPPILRDFIRACFAEGEKRPTIDTLMRGPIISEAAKNSSCEEWDAHRVVTIRREAAKAMQDNLPALQAEWLKASEARSVQKQNSEESYEDFQSNAVKDIELLLPTIIGMISDVHELAKSVKGPKYPNLSAVSRSLIEGGAGRFSRACEVVHLLSELQAPPVPATFDESLLARGTVHFVIKILWSTPFFAGRPYVMWVFRDLLNQTVEEAMREFVLKIPSVGRNELTVENLSVTEPSRPQSANEFDRLTVAGLAGFDDVIRTGFAEIGAKLDSVLHLIHGGSDLVKAARKSEASRLQSASDVAVNPDLRRFLEKRGVPESDEFAAILSRERITVDQLEQQVFTRQELTSVGIPLGVAGMLVP